MNPFWLPKSSPTTWGHRPGKGWTLRSLLRKTENCEALLGTGSSGSLVSGSHIFPLLSLSPPVMALIATHILTLHRTGNGRVDSCYHLGVLKPASATAFKIHLKLKRGRAVRPGWDRVRGHHKRLGHKSPCVSSLKLSENLQRKPHCFIGEKTPWRPGTGQVLNSMHLCCIRGLANRANLEVANIEAESWTVAIHDANSIRV